MHVLGLLHDRLYAEQLEFLGDVREHPSWDFVAYTLHGNQRYLIEVKIGRLGRRIDTFRPKGRREMAPNELQQARSLGFTILLVGVQLTDAWEAIVTEREITVPLDSKPWAWNP